jgi:hypothetical protein
MTSPGSSSTGWVRPALQRVLGSPSKVFAAAFAVLAVNMALWSLATPLFASPDEPAHVERAVALYRGQLIGTTQGSASNPLTGIAIPELYTHGGPWSGCFTFKETVSSVCAGAFTGTSKIFHTTTYVGRYPPLYYAVVGLPSVFTVSTKGIYAMRMMSDLLNSAILALAVMSVVVWSRNRYLLIGLLIAITPMTLFLGSVVNPSGFEIASAICLWTSGLVLVLDHAERPPPRLVATVAGSAALLLLARPLSPLWAAVILVVLALIAGLRGTLSLLRDRSVRWSLALLVPAALFAGIWIVAAHSLDLLPVGAKALPGETRAHLLGTIVGNTGTWLQQMIGIFGWLDTLSPLVTYLAWYAAIGLVLLLALACARARHSATLALVVGIVVVVPVVISYGQAHRIGVIWQARYIMPIAVGVPLLAVALIALSPALQPARWRLASILCAVLAIGQFCAFYEAMRRYAVGVLGPLDFIHSAFHPPLGSLTLVVGALVASVLMAGLIRLVLSLEPPGQDPVEPLSTHTLSELLPA